MHAITSFIKLHRTYLSISHIIVSSRNFDMQGTKPVMPSQSPPPLPPRFIFMKAPPQPPPLCYLFSTPRQLHPRPQIPFKRFGLLNLHAILAQLRGKLHGPLIFSALKFPSGEP